MNSNAVSRVPVVAMKKHFVLQGFDQQAGVRQYAFELTARGLREAFTVCVDLALLRVYRISIQELPLLCRELLERQPEDAQSHDFTLTEGDMRAHRDQCTAVREEAERRRKGGRKPAAAAAGGGWRQPLA